MANWTKECLDLNLNFSFRQTGSDSSAHEPVVQNRACVDVCATAAGTKAQQRLFAAALQIFSDLI